MKTVPIEKLASVIAALQVAAMNYSAAVLQDVANGKRAGGALRSAGATLDLEQMALQYVRTLDEEHLKMDLVDYTNTDDPSKKPS